MIPYGKQTISDEDVAVVVDTLRSDFLTQGPAVPNFESSVASYTGAKYAVATNSATSALHIACLAVGLSKGDLLWTVPNTFVASANCGLYCGADVDFVDIDVRTYNISIDKLEEKLQQARKIGKLPRVLISVHFAGQPAAQDRIWVLSQEYGFTVIEDASHAIGATYKQEKMGSCRWSAISVFSFHPVKNMTTGEGGLATTNNACLAKRMRLLRSHGITKDPNEFVSERYSEWSYEQQHLGFNYRMSDIQAALGSSQLTRLDEWLKKRQEIAEFYQEELAHFDIGMPQIIQGAQSAWHLFVVRFDASQRLLVYNTLREVGIHPQVHYTPVHLQPFFKSLGFCKGDFINSELHGESALSLPIFPDLTGPQQQSVVSTLIKVLSRK